MPTIIFIGRVHPERADITLRIQTPERRLPAFNRAAMPPLPAFTMGFSLIRSQIFAICELPEFQEAWIPTIRNCVDEAARAWVDLFGFLEGGAYQVEITSWIDPSTERHELLGYRDGAARDALQSPDLPDLVQRDAGYGQALIALALTDDGLRMALAECRRALLYAGSTLSHCYRAVEGLRRNLVGGDPSPATWQRFREQLRIEEAPLRTLADRAAVVRHGEEPFIGGEERSSFLAFTWKIVERYAKVRLNYPNAPLPHADFPMIGM